MPSPAPLALTLSGTFKTVICKFLAPTPPKTTKGVRGREACKSQFIRLVFVILTLFCNFVATIRFTLHLISNTLK